MVVVDYAAKSMRDYFTSLTDFLAIGTSTTETINVTSSTLAGSITTVAKQSISYPDDKTFTLEYILPAGASNGNTLRRIAVKNTLATTQVITLSNIPSLDKNTLVEVAFEVTLEVDNE